MTEKRPVIEYKLSRRKNVYGEWVIRAWVDGVRTPELDTYEDDKLAAEQTCHFANSFERAKRAE